MNHLIKTSRFLRILQSGEHERCLYLLNIPVGLLTVIAPKPFFFSSTVPKWVHHAVKPVVLALEKYIPHPYAGEIRGLASHFGDSLSDVIILNFAYEISAYVSSQDLFMVDHVYSANI